MERGISVAGYLTRHNTRAMPYRHQPDSSTTVFHIMNRGNDHQTLFRSNADFLTFRNLTEKYKKKYEVAIYYYVFMPNHIHFMLEVQIFENISAFMRDLTFIYARSYHRQYEGDGHVWTGRFKCKPIEKDDYLVKCGEYIEANPVRAGIVKKPEEYPWSSARAHICQLPDPIVDPCPYR